MSTTCEICLVQTFRFNILYIKFQINKNFIWETALNKQKFMVFLKIVLTASSYFTQTILAKYRSIFLGFVLLLSLNNPDK